MDEAGTGPARAVAPGPAAKYEIMAGLAAAALAEGRERTALRLLLLLLRRYNWATDALSIGRAEIAALWGVDERTVRRELARFRLGGWLVLKRPARRGRVALYGLGPALRPGARAAPPGAGGQVVAFPRGEERPGLAGDEVAGLWAAMRSRLARWDPDVTRTWFAGLSARATPDALVLVAPTAYAARWILLQHGARLRAALEAEGGGNRRLLVEGPGPADSLECEASPRPAVTAC